MLDGSSAAPGQNLETERSGAGMLFHIRCRAEVATFDQGKASWFLDGSSH
jgi:hypothetical protein